jgi:hypothetical protein
LSSSLCAASLPCNYLLSHRTRFTHRLGQSDNLETLRCMLFYEQVRAYLATSLRGRIHKARAFLCSIIRTRRAVSRSLNMCTRIATTLRRVMRTKTYSHR